MIWLAPWPSLPISPVSKLDRRHTWRIRKRDNLVRGGGMGWERSQIIQRRESLVLYKYSILSALASMPCLFLSPSLRDKAHGGVLCTFSTRTSATAAGFARRSQLSSSRLGQMLRSVREGVHHNTNDLSSSQPCGPPCWVISLAFGVIAFD